MPALAAPHLHVLFPELRTLPKTDPRRANIAPSITNSAVVDRELYTLFALLIRDFIHPWYRLFTNDHDLSHELVRILINVTKNLQTRFEEQVDWTELALVAIPRLVTMHYHDYRRAKSRLHSAFASGSVSLVDLFHGMQPHFALEPGKDREAEYLRCLVDSVLVHVLDKSEYESDVVRHLLREVLANVVLGNVIESISDPFIVNTIICKLLVRYETQLDALEASGDFAETFFSALTQDHPRTPTTPSTSSILDGLQRFKEKQQEQDGHEEADVATDSSADAGQQQRRFFSFSYITLQVIIAPLQRLWIQLVAMLTLSQARYQSVYQHRKKTQQQRLLEPTTDMLRVAFCIDDRPAQQWAWQMIAMFIWPLVRLFGGGLLVDKFLEQSVLYMFNEAHVAYYLRLVRDLLWPDGVFLQRRDAPTPLQREQMRIRAERLLTVAMPSTVRTLLFGQTDLNELQIHMHEALEPLQNKCINKHLFFLLVDLVASTLEPDLSMPSS